MWRPAGPPTRRGRSEVRRGGHDRRLSSDPRQRVVATRCRATVRQVPVASDRRRRPLGDVSAAAPSCTPGVGTPRRSQAPRRLGRRRPGSSSTSSTGRSTPCWRTRGSDGLDGARSGLRRRPVPRRRRRAPRRSARAAAAGRGGHRARRRGRRSRAPAGPAPPSSSSATPSARDGRPPVDVVVGNPPFLNQLAAAHDPWRALAARRRPLRRCRRRSSSRWPSAWPARDGGRVGLVLPQSVARSRDAAPSARAVARRAPRSTVVLVVAARRSSTPRCARARRARADGAAPAAVRAATARPRARSRPTRPARRAADLVAPAGRRRRDPVGRRLDTDGDARRPRRGDRRLPRPVLRPGRRSSGRRRPTPRSSRAARSMPGRCRGAAVRPGSPAAASSRPASTSPRSRRATGPLGRRPPGAQGAPRHPDRRARGGRRPGGRWVPSVPVVSVEPRQSRRPLALAAVLCSPVDLGVGGGHLSAVRALGATAAHQRSRASPACRSRWPAGPLDVDLPCALRRGDLDGLRPARRWTRTASSGARPGARCSAGGGGGPPAATASARLGGERSRASRR